MDPIAELMSPEPIKVRVDDRVADCLVLLKRHGVGHLPVVDQDGVLVGLATDFALHLTDPGADARTAMVPTVSCREEVDVSLALRELRDTTQDAIVITNAAHHPVGIFTEHDAARLAPALLEQTVLAIRRPGRALITVSPDEMLSDAFDRMIDRQVRHLPVLEGEAIIGVISLRDLLKAGVTRNAVGQVRSLVHGGEVHVVIEGLPLSEVATRMANFRVGCLPIVDFAHRLVGVVTRSDIIDLTIATLVGHESLPDVWSRLGPG